MSGLSPENRALVERDEELNDQASCAGFDTAVAYLSTGLGMTDLNRLLDAARAEGRAMTTPTGEGEPADSEFFDAVVGWLAERDLIDRRDALDGLTVSDVIAALEEHENGMATATPTGDGGAGSPPLLTRLCWALLGEPYCRHHGKRHMDIHCLYGAVCQACLSEACREPK